MFQEEASQKAVGVGVKGKWLKAKVSNLSTGQLACSAF
jgi:hypothetical protein